MKNNAWKNAASGFTLLLVVIAVLLAFNGYYIFAGLALFIRIIIGLVWKV